MTGVSAGDVALIKASGMFDETWYLDQYPDVRKLGMDPVEHYLWIGPLLRRNPSPKFDSTAYLQVNDDVAATGVNPLLHYARWGRTEGRPVTLVVDVAMPTAPSIRKGAVAPVIAYESHNLKHQGAPNSLFEIASGMKQRGNFHPILFANSTGPLVEQYQARNIDAVMHGVSPNRLKDSATREKYIQALGDFYLRHRVSLVHVNTLQNFHSVLAADRVGIPAIWNIRESEDPETYYDYLAPDLREQAYSCFGKASAVVFVAEATRKLWQPRLTGLVDNLSILNGIDTDRIMKFVYGANRPSLRAALGVGESDVLLLNVGTVSERKGQQDLVAGLKLLDNETRRRIVLAVVGFNSTHYSKSTMADLDALRKEGVRMHLLDESPGEEDRRKVAELYLAADAFVLTSRVESYPRVTLEAMEFGLPIISTPCFGVCEQLVANESVLFYAEGDAQQLSSHIRLLCHDKHERQKMGQAANARLKHLNSYEQMLAAYESVYRRVLGTSRRSLKGVA